MYTASRVVFFKAMSGIHAGSGADLGVVDLPIQRERHTGFPKVESSGVKGCLREEFEILEKNGKIANDFVKIAFGPEEDGGKGTRHSGALAFTDARLLLFPVRSAKGVFAYATCPLILSRLADDFHMAGLTPPEITVLSDKALVSDENTLTIKKGKVVILEEYTYDAEYSTEARKLAIQIAKWLDKPNDEYLLKNLIILPNDEFKDFTQNATEIITRIKIDESKGIVEKGALFTEELLPTETVLYSLAMGASMFLPADEREKPFAKAVENSGKQGEYILNLLSEHMPKYTQIGGNATIGKGLVAVTVVKGGAIDGK